MSKNESEIKKLFATKSANVSKFLEFLQFSFKILKETDLFSNLSLRVILYLLFAKPAPN
jgi:hypothetical protein